MPYYQTRVPCINVWRPFPRHRSPSPIEQSQHEQCFSDGQKQRREDIARPVRTEINSRVTDGCDDDPVEPAASIKQRAIYGDHRVVRHMSRWKRWPRLVSIGLIGKTDGRFFEQSHEFQVRPLHFDHPHTLDLLGPMPIDHRLQYARKQLCDQQRQDQADYERAALKPAKKECAQSDPNEQRLPNLAVAERRHQQVEQGTRPFFVDKMKQSLVHAIE